MKKRTLSLLLAVACALSLALAAAAAAPRRMPRPPPGGAAPPAAVDQTRGSSLPPPATSAPASRTPTTPPCPWACRAPDHQGRGGKPAPGPGHRVGAQRGLHRVDLPSAGGVTFSNGTPFNADSVLANFDRMKKGPSSPPSTA